MDALISWNHWKFVNDVFLWPKQQINAEISTKKTTTENDTKKHM